MFDNTLYNDTHINRIFNNLINNKDELFSEVMQIIQTKQTLEQFKPIYRQHTNFANLDIEYKLGELHIYKPIVKDYRLSSGKKYIGYISKLFDIDKETSITYLKKFKGDVYNTILFG